VSESVAEVAQLQDELRRTESELRQLEQGAGAFERFLAGTALENRAAINRELDDARARQAAVAADRRALAEQAQVSPDVIELRTGLVALGQLVGDRRAETENERASVLAGRRRRRLLQTEVAVASLVTSRPIDSRAAARADDEVEVEESCAGDDRLGQSPKLCTQLVAELGQLVRTSSRPPSRRPAGYMTSSAASSVRPTMSDAGAVHLARTLAPENAADDRRRTPQRVTIQTPPSLRYRRHSRRCSSRPTSMATRDRISSRSFASSVSAARRASRAAAFC
jgi:hypothetical protein